MKYFSIAKLFLIALLRNNYLSPKCIGDQSDLGISSLSMSFFPQYIFGNFLVIGLKIADCSVIAVVIVQNSDGETL